MVKLTKIYTRGGDGGETSLGDGTRTAKDHPRVAAIGAVDEANAALGLARLHSTDSPETDGLLARLQNDLFDLGADLCTPEDGPRAQGALRITEGQVTRLEADIDAVNAGLPALESFVLPGGSALAAHLHLARTLTRRAERLTVALAAVESINTQALAYLNRLSDLLFVLARAANAGNGGDVLWTPGAGR